MSETEALTVEVRDELLAKMRAQLHVWEDEEPREDWWSYQREYGEAFLRIEHLQSEIERLTQRCVTRRHT